MRYQLVRDKKLFELDHDDVEICDDIQEICNFSVKEVMNLLNELKESDFKEKDVYVDIYSVLQNLVKTNDIKMKKIQELFVEKEKDQGGYSKYLLKIK